MLGPWLPSRVWGSPTPAEVLQEELFGFISWFVPIVNVDQPYSGRSGTERC